MTYSCVDCLQHVLVPFQKVILDSVCDICNAQHIYFLGVDDILDSLDLVELLIFDILVYAIIQNKLGQLQNFLIDIIELVK